MAELFEELRAREPVHHRTFDLGEIEFDAHVAQLGNEVGESIKRAGINEVDRATDQHEMPQLRSLGGGTKHKVLNVLHVREVEALVNPQHEDVRQSLCPVTQHVAKVLGICDPTDDGHVRSARAPEVENNRRGCADEDAFLDSEREHRDESEDQSGGVRFGVVPL